MEGSEERHGHVQMNTVVCFFAFPLQAPQKWKLVHPVLQLLLTAHQRRPIAAPVPLPAASPTGSPTRTPPTVPSGTGSNTVPLTEGDGSSDGTSIRLSGPLFFVLLFSASYGSTWSTY
ncbi:hypothetical protein CRG98_040111 [Punica granatum]|uniref:Uncharacterized protein n=1 Tax=Punica granatum TaxID=22663 RepID=A0A2I0I6A1_PUNGR|nr:hypothetical protein CRG98_040111 [Punica granatum]